MAFKDTQTKRERLSSIVSGDVRDRNRAGPSMIRLNSAATMPSLGMPVSGLRGTTSKAPKDTSRVNDLPPGSVDIRGYFGDERTGVRKPTSRFSPAKKQVVAPEKGKPKAPARKLTEINVPGGGLRTARPASAKTTRPLTASEARSQAPGNYRTGKVTMGGKTYTGYTVSSRTDSKGRTTKSVGNWTSTPNAGRSTNRFGGKNDVAGPTKNAAGKNASSASGKRK